MRRLAASAGLALALAHTFASGCESAEISRDDIACVRNTECPASLTCSFNHCIAAGTNALTVQMRVTPPVSSGLLVQNAPNVRLADGPDLVVKLLEPASVRGVVRIDKDALTVNVPGDLEVRSSGDIVGLDYRFVGKSLQGVDSDGFGFKLVVLPGRRYQGVFRPSDPALARANFTIETADDSGFTVNLGTIATATATAIGAYPVPEASMTVRRYVRLKAACAAGETITVHALLQTR